MKLRRSIAVMGVVLFAVVGLGGAALFFWGGKPDETPGAVSGEVVWETDTMLDGATIVTADEDYAILRSKPSGLAVDLVAIDLDTGAEVLRDQFEFLAFPGAGLHDGRLVYIQDGFTDVVSHDLREGESWTFSLSRVRTAQATARGVVVTGPENDDMNVLDPTTGNVLWQQAGFGAPVRVYASTMAVDVDGELVVYDISSGDELWRVSRPWRRFVSRHSLTSNAEVFVVQQETMLVGYEPRSGAVLWEHPVDTGDSESEFFHADEENLVLECVAGTTWFTVRSIDDRTGEVLATVNHDPQSSLVGYNSTALILSLGEPPGGCITYFFEQAMGPLEGYGLRDGDRRWTYPLDAADLSQPASGGADDRPGAGLRTDVIRRPGPLDESLGYFFATTGEDIASTKNADAIDVVAGQLVTTTLTDTTVTVALTAPRVTTISGRKGTSGAGTVYPVQGGLLVLAGQTLALVG